MAKAETVIAVAKSFVGTREDPPGSNRQPFGADIDANYKGWYNGNKNGYDWCTQYHDDMFLRAYGEAEARRLLCRPNKSYNLGAVVKYAWNYYAQEGRTGNKPRVGCSIFFKNDRGLSHIGIVQMFDDKYVYTYEGNSGTNHEYVTNDRYLLTDSRIAGYGYPAYDEEDTPYIVGGLYKKVCRDFLNIREKPSLSGKICGRLDGTPVVRCCGVSIDEKENIWLDIGNLWICARYGKEVYVK